MKRKFLYLLTILSFASFTSCDLLDEVLPEEEEEEKIQYGTGEIVSCDAELHFTFDGSYVKDNAVIIDYTVTYTGEGDITFGNLQSPSHNSDGYVFDDLGNEYSDVIMTIGENSSTWSVSNVIPAGVPVKCSLQINNIDVKASMLPIIKLGITNDKLDERFLYFKNVEIPGRTKYIQPTADVNGEIVSCDADLQFAFSNIETTATTVTINYTVTYTGEGDITFGNLQSPSHNSDGYIFDDLGNEYSNVLMTIGENSSTWSVSNIIPAGIPVKCSIKINDVNAKASMLPTIKLGITNDKLDERFLYFKNVEIPGRTKHTSSTTDVEGEIVSCDEDLQFAFTSLVRTATTVTINYSVTYTGEGDITFGTLQSPANDSQSYIYDDLGNEYSDIVLSIGGNSSTRSVSNLIPAGVPVNCSIKINDVNAKATTFSIIKLGIWYNSDIDEDFLYFKNVKI